MASHRHPRRAGVHGRSPWSDAGASAIAIRRRACGSTVAARTRAPRRRRMRRSARAARAPVGAAAARRRRVERDAARERAVRPAAHAGGARDRGLFGRRAPGRRGAGDADRRPLPRRTPRRRPSTSRCATRSRASACAATSTCRASPTTGAPPRSRSRPTSCCARAGPRSRSTRRARGRRRRGRPQVVGSVQQVLAPARAATAAALGARGGLNTTSAASTDADRRGRVGRVRLRRGSRWRSRARCARPVGDGAARPGERARGGRRAWRCCPRSRRPARVAGRGRRRRRRAGSSSAPSRRRARRPPPTRTCSRPGAAARSAGWRSVDRVHACAGLTGGVALRGVEATDAGVVVARARGVAPGRDARTGGAVTRRARSGSARRSRSRWRAAAARAAARCCARPTAPRRSSCS